MSRVDLAWEERGLGPAVVLLHAFPLDRAMWAQVADRLADDARVVSVDLPGCGRTPVPDDAVPSLDAAADGVVALLDRLGLDRAVVAGLSMGGYVALSVAERHADRLSGLGLLDTKTAADTDEARATRLKVAQTVTGPAGVRALADMPSTLLGPTTLASRPDVVAAVAGTIASANPSGVAWCQRAMAARPDRTAVLASVAVPALVLVGDQDTVTPVSEAEAMAERLPDAELVVVSDAGHLTVLEDPDAVTAALRRLVRRAG